ncbi:transposase [Nocardia sp. BMG51109]|uniref:transposase n=1 Tax=Nocardia sp. BMG51109 TaxID=1056816 RepID=UPI001E57EF94|nr:transposase [Nocardia sp. BMG51109]
MDAILYIVRGGIAWRRLPMEFPPAGTVCAVFARWSHSGAWQRIVDALRDRPRVRERTAARRRHRCLDPGPRRRAPTPDRTARQVLHHPAGPGRRRLSRTAARLGERRSRPAYFAQCPADYLVYRVVPSDVLADYERGAVDGEQAGGG